MNTLIISLVTVICSVVGALLAVSNLYRASRKEATMEATTDAKSSTRLETKLDYVSKGVDDIRLDNKDQGRRLNDISERIASVEEVAKSAHKRIDELEK